MKDLKYNNDLKSYALAFASFVLPKLSEIREIVLFGSVVRNEADKNSDIDLFIDIGANNNEEQIKKIVNVELKRFSQSKISELWKLRGINNEINVLVGNLDEWELRRSIVGEGVTLYGKFKEIPKNLKNYVYYNILPIKNIAKRNKIIRNLFGRKEKNYSQQGMVFQFGGKRESPSSFFVPVENSRKINAFLEDNHVDYRFFEIWTDQIN